MPTQEEVLQRIRELESELGIEPQPEKPTQAQIDERISMVQQELAMLPMTFDEFVAKEEQDKARPLTEKAVAFGSALGEGAADFVGMGVDAAGELIDKEAWWMVTPLAPIIEYETLGDTINVGGRDFARFIKTLGASVLDDPDKAVLAGPVTYMASLAMPEEGKQERAYKRYVENFDYNTKVRPKMLEEVEYPKLVDFQSQFVDPFMAFPVAKVGGKAAQLTLKATEKGLAKGAQKLGSEGLTRLSRAAETGGKAVQKLEKGVDIATKVGTYPTEMAARAGSQAIRKAVKGGVGATGIALKGIGQLGKATEKVAAAPRKIATKAIEKLAPGPGSGGAVIGGQIVGGVTGAIPMAAELGIAEGVGVIARKTGMELGEVLTTFAQPASQKRFLYRLATNEAVSPATRKLAMYAYERFGTAGGDALFNMVANGISLGAINAGLAGLSGASAEEAGAAAGAGIVAGGVMPTGHAGMRAGKRDIARDARSIDQHMRNKLTQEQRKQFKRLPKPAQLMLATLQESGIGAPKFLIIEPKAYLEMLNADRAEKGDPLLDRAPAGHYDKPSRTIYMNAANLPRSAKVATEVTAHEVGHDFVYQALGNDPTMLQLLLEQYKATPEEGTAFYYNYDREGNPVGDPIYLNDDAVDIAADYDRKQVGIDIGRNASTLAQEIGADQFAMMFTENPNAFDHFHPQLRRTLIDASRRLLTAIGVVEPLTGNPLSNPISKVQLNNPALQRLYRNYGKARAVELDEKAILSKDSIVIEPKKGQTGDERFVELFGGQGLSLRDAKSLSIRNKSLVREVQRIRDDYKKDPRDTWSVSKTGRLVGKNLTEDLRNIFMGSDPFGNVRNLLDALQEAITQRIGIRFGYRSGTKGKYQNRFRIRDVAIYGWWISPLTIRKNSRGEESYPNLKVLGFDQSVVRSNVQTLVEKGFIKDPRKFMDELSEQGQAALADPEGRINPEGRKENELMTVAFGLKESAPQIASPRLKELLESGDIKKTFRSYDVEALAGLAKGQDKAFAFNYENIRDNYNPFRQLFMPAAFHGTPHTFKAEEGAPFGRFRTSQIGTGEGAQAFGHGLYFSSKREVAEYYKNALTDQMPTNRDIIIGYNLAFGDGSNLQHQISKGRVTAKEEQAYRKIAENAQFRDAKKRSDRERIFRKLWRKESPRGSLYKVELAPKESEYLLWDKPLKDQPKGVREKLEAMPDNSPFAKGDTGVLQRLERRHGDMLASDFYRILEGHSFEESLGSGQAASAALKEAGIPGIKYKGQEGKGDFNYVIFDEADVTITDKLFMPVGPESADAQFQISTRNPTAKGRVADPVKENLVIGIDAILADPKLTASYAEAIQRYPGFKKTNAKPEEVIENFIQMGVENLLFLHDQVPAITRERSKNWYDGARVIAERFAEKFKASVRAVAGVLAAESPRTDWFINVDKARRTLDIFHSQQETVFDKKLTSQYVKTAKPKDKAAIRALAKTYEGKKFKDLPVEGMAAFIRAFDELNFDRDYQIISPEGDFMGPAKTKEGQPKVSTPGSEPMRVKSLRVLLDDSKPAISNAMGAAHKIRNFFNNILLPNKDANSVTVDTHAVAAMLLRPLSADSLEVSNMLGAKGKEAGSASIPNNSVEGIKGMYGIYAEAYRRAAQQRGLKPREMQSITWEAIRGLYPKDIKRAPFKETINNLWRDYENGKINIDDVRTKILKEAGGIDPPDWVRIGDRSRSSRPGGRQSPQGSRLAPYEGQLFHPSVSRFGIPADTGGVRTATSWASQPRGLSQFEAPAAYRASQAGELPERFRGR